MKLFAKPLIFLILVVFTLQGCYEDYRFDYDYSAVYFAVQNPVRTVIVEEGKDLTLEIGVVLGGKYVNEKAETVQYKIAPELLNEHPQFKLLPENYYTLSNASEITVPAGAFLGTVEVKLNENFLQDTEAHKMVYALPVQITSASTDSVLAEKDYSIVVVNYQNKYYGSYWVKGVDQTVDGANQVVSAYRYSNKDLVSNIFTVFSTEAADTSLLSYVGLDITGKNSMKIGVNNENVSVSSGKVSDVSNVSGTGVYNAGAKAFYLDYSYEKAGEKHQVKDTLIWFATPQEMETWQ